jgi:hypothetical protein
MLGIIFISLALIVGTILTILDKSKRKIWISFTVLSVVFSLIPIFLSFSEKNKQSKEDAIYKYKSLISDDKIMEDLHEMAINFDKGVLFANASPTLSSFNKPAELIFIKIPSHGIPTKYKVVDPSEYGLQNITTLMPVQFHDSVYFIGAVTISKKYFNKSTKITVISKYDNGLMDVEQFKLRKCILNWGTFHNFFPLLLTNHERLQIVQKIAKLCNFPSVSEINESIGYIKFGPYGNSKGLPSAKIELKEIGYEGNLKSIPEQSRNKFCNLMKEKVNQSPSESLNYISSK